MVNKKQTVCNPLNSPYQGETAKWFTLVELIVVVTILAILATIGFVSYSSYLTGVRDTNRLAQLVSIHDWLALYSTRKELPLPDENIEIKIGTSEVIWYQWYAWSNTLETIDFTKGWVDPKDKSYFTYYLTKDRKFFQLLAHLEEEIDNVSNNTLIADTLAVNYDSRIVTTYGKELWVLTDVSNTPAQELPLLSSAWEVDISSTTDYRAYFDDVTMFEWNGAELAAKVTLHTNHTSGFEPGDVSGLYMWFDANDSTTIEKTAWNVITKWNDKSNNNNHMDVIEWDPTYWDYSINGSKTVYFDGNDSMHTTATFDAPYTIMYVAQMEGSQSLRALSGDYNSIVWYYINNKNDLYLNWSWLLNSSTLSWTETELFSLRRDLAKATDFYNNWQKLTLSNETAWDVLFWKLRIGWAWPNWWWLVGYQKSKVYLAEVIVFDRVISDNDRKKIEAYLNKKWGPF